MRSKHSTGRSRCCPCGPASPSAAATITSGGQPGSQALPLDPFGRRHPHQHPALLHQNPKCRPPANHNGNNFRIGTLVHRGVQKIHPSVPRHSRSCGSVGCAASESFVCSCALSVSEPGRGRRSGRSSGACGRWAHASRARTRKTSTLINLALIHHHLHSRFHDWSGQQNNTTATSEFFNRIPQTADLRVDLSEP
jgi:hypothetical protein